MQLQSQEEYGKMWDETQNRQSRTVADQEERIVRRQCRAELESALIRGRIRALSGLGGPYLVQYSVNARETAYRSRVWFRTGLERQGRVELEQDLLCAK